MKDIAKSRLFDLYKIAISDGKITENEYRLLFDIAELIELSQDDVLDIINQDIDFNIESPKDISERVQHLFQMLFMMKIDGDINQKEIQSIQDIALYLGLNLKMTDELIELINKYVKNIVPQEEMIRIVKLHMN